MIILIFIILKIFGNTVKNYLNIKVYLHKYHYKNQNQIYISILTKLTLDLALRGPDFSYK